MDVQHFLTKLIPLIISGWAPRGLFASANLESFHLLGIEIIWVTSRGSGDWGGVSSLICPELLQTNSLHEPLSPRCCLCVHVYKIIESDWLQYMRLSYSAENYWALKSTGNHKTSKLGKHMSVCVWKWVLVPRVAFNKKNEYCSLEYINPSLATLYQLLLFLWKHTLAFVIIFSCLLFRCVFLLDMSRGPAIKRHTAVLWHMKAFSTINKVLWDWKESWTLTSPGLFVIV